RCRGGNRPATPQRARLGAAAGGTTSAGGRMRRIDAAPPAMKHRVRGARARGECAQEGAAEPETRFVATVPPPLLFPERTVIYRSVIYRSVIYRSVIYRTVIYRPLRPSFSPNTSPREARPPCWLRMYSR